MQLTDEQWAIQDLVREVAAEEIRPGAAKADRDGEFPEDVWDELGDLDLTGLTTPEAYGGFDADRVTYALVNEELAHGSLAVATALSVHCLATSCIAEFGTEDQRERWLSRMSEGRPVGAFALSETHAGSTPAGMSTHARRDSAEETSADPREATDASREGDEYVLNGDKQWITNGSRAGVAIVFAKVDPDDPDSVTQFLVPTDTEGVSVGKKEDKLGLRASDTVSLTFDDARIPTENRLTEEGRGLAAALSILTGGRIGIAAQAVGVSQAALDAAIDYATEREQFDRPIADFQAIRHKVAEMHTRTAAARLLTRNAARRAEAGEDVRTEASMAKYFASESAVEVANEAIQVHGGYGYTTDFPVERLYRDAKITTIYEGTTQIQRDVIGRGLLE
jgi:alkylation response protein AidB-like acyl-CoA dehydrogenase